MCEDYEKPLVVDEHEEFYKGQHVRATCYQLSDYKYDLIWCVFVKGKDSRMSYGSCNHAIETAKYAIDNGLLRDECWGIAALNHLIAKQVRNHCLNIF